MGFVRAALGVLLLSACGNTDHGAGTSAGGAEEAGSSGAGGTDAAPDRGPTSPGTDGSGAPRDAGSGALRDAGSGAPRDAGSGEPIDPYTCETDGGPAPIRRPGCAEPDPRVSDCAGEGLLCLYETDDAKCFDQWECLFGLWSPRERECMGELEEASASNDPTCPPGKPVIGAPCAPSELECQYDRCWNGSFVSVVSCVCGRWQQTDRSCPTGPP